MSDKKPIFRPLDADDSDPQATIINSCFCTNCGGQGQTRLLLAKIPFYKEVIVMSFTCDDCNYQNNEIQSGSTIPEHGIQITLTVNEKTDLNRQLVKSDYTSIKIPELDFEVPAKTQKGEITTVEGIIRRAITGLSQDQSPRREQHPDAAEQIDVFINKLENLLDLEPHPFTLILRDISGNSFIENLHAPKTDPNCITTYFQRTIEEDQLLGIFAEIQQENHPSEPSLLHRIKENEYPIDNIEDGEVVQFPTNCPSCGSPCETNMKMTDIPHFKSVIIMATVCEICGYRTNEVKSGAGIESKGVRIEINVRNKADLTRDVLKSETCELKIPELELDVGPHALGGRFTTIEGLIVAIKEQLNDSTFSHVFDDSQEKKSKKRYEEFLTKFDDIVNNKLEITIILDDPCGNSYIQSLKENDELDDQLKIIHYERSVEQNEDLGLNDMKTENYEEEDKIV